MRNTNLLILKAMLNLVKALSYSSTYTESLLEEIIQMIEREEKE